jgi:hypothetical protein
MRLNDNFNIITGECKPRATHSSNNRRFASLDLIRAMKEQDHHALRKDVPQHPHRGLGRPRDHQLYQYSYLPKSHFLGQTESLKGTFDPT